MKKTAKLFVKICYLQQWNIRTLFGCIYVYDIFDCWPLPAALSCRLVPTVTSRSTIKVSCRSFPGSRLSSIIIMMLNRVGNPWVLWWSEEEVNTVLLTTNHRIRYSGTNSLFSCSYYTGNLRMLLWLLLVRCQCYVY